MKDIEIKKQTVKYIKEYFADWGKDIFRDYGIDELNIYGAPVPLVGYTYFVEMEFFDRQNRKDAYIELKYDVGIKVKIISLIEVEYEDELLDINGAGVDIFCTNAMLKRKEIEKCVREKFRGCNVYQELGEGNWY